MIALTGLLSRLDEDDGIDVTTQVRAGRMVFAIGRDSGEARAKLVAMAGAQAQAGQNSSSLDWVSMARS